MGASQHSLGSVTKAGLDISIVILRIKLRNLDFFYHKSCRIRNGSHFQKESREQGFLLGSEAGELVGVVVAGRNNWITISFIAVKNQKNYDQLKFVCHTIGLFLPKMWRQCAVKLS